MTEWSFKRPWRVRLVSHSIDENTEFKWFVQAYESCFFIFHVSRQIGLSINTKILIELIFCCIKKFKDEKKFIFFFFFGCPTANGVSRPEIRSELPSKPTPQLRQCRILNPLYWARDRTCIPALPGCCQSRCTTAGTPQFLI